MQADIRTNWLSGNAFVIAAVGLRFKSWAGQIGYSVANSLLLLKYFFERSCFAGCNDVEIGPANYVQASA